jgi:hypothetical protein
MWDSVHGAGFGIGRVWRGGERIVLGGELRGVRTLVMAMGFLVDTVSCGWVMRLID